MKRFVVGSFTFLLLSTVLIGTVHAQGADREVARRHFERGVALYEAENFDGALEEFRAAYEAQPHPSVLVNIANCYARTNRPVRAISDARMMRGGNTAISVLPGYCAVKDASVLFQSGVPGRCVETVRGRFSAACDGRFQ